MPRGPDVIKPNFENPNATPRKRKTSDTSTHSYQFDATATAFSSRHLKAMRFLSAVDSKLTEIGVHSQLLRTSRERDTESNVVPKGSCKKCAKQNEKNKLARRQYLTNGEMWVTQLGL